MRRSDVARCFRLVPLALGGMVLGLLSLRGAGAVSGPETEQEVVWQVHTRSEVVEERVVLTAQVVDLGPFEEVEAPPTQVLGEGTGQRVEVAPLVSAGIGGRRSTGTFTSIADLAEDREGNLWVAGGGIHRFDGQTWTTFTPEDGLTNIVVWKMAVDAQGDLWLASPGGVTQFDGQHWIQYRLGVDRIGMNLKGIAIAPNGDVWAGGAYDTGRYDRNFNPIIEPLLYRFDGTDWWEYTPASGLPSPGSILRLVVDAQGTVWMVNLYGPNWLISYNGTQFTSHDLSLPIGAIYLDRQDRLWIGARSLYVKAGDVWQRMTNEKLNRVSTISEDPLGRLWIYDNHRWGVLEGTRWTFFENGSHPSVLLADRRGNLWMKKGRGELIEWPLALRPTWIEGEARPASPTGFRLYPNYPNPFNRQTMIAFDLPRRQHLSLQVLDLSGQVVDILAEGTYAAGGYRASWDGRTTTDQEVGSGLYLYRLATPDRALVGKMTLVK